MFERECHHIECMCTLLPLWVMTYRARLMRHALTRPVLTRHMQSTSQLQGSA